jgi:hypothetical protein
MAKNQNRKPMLSVQHDFQFLVGKEHLKPMAQKYSDNGLWIEISYGVGKYGRAEPYRIVAGEAAHRQIIWTDKLYKEIHDAAENNYQSLGEVA